MSAKLALIGLTKVAASKMSTITTNMEYFNNANKADDGSNGGTVAWTPWSELGWNKAGSFTKGGDPGRQRLTTYPDDQPYLYDDKQGGNKRLSWYHKRNFTLYLVNNGLGGTAPFPGNNFQLRGQSIFKFTGKINGYCWDGQTRKTVWKAANDPAAGIRYEKYKYFGCAIDFVGSSFVNGKRSLPIGYFHDEPIYAVKRVDDAPIVEVEVPAHEAVLPDSRDSFPLDS